MDIIISEENGIRKLQFGPKLMQGTMKIDAPHVIQMEYAREMMAPLLLNSDPDWPRNVLVIGLGVGAIPQFLHHYKPGCAITTVEISQEVVKAAQDHFNLPPLTDNFQVVVQCGAEFIQNCTTQYDLIVLDAYSEDLESDAIHTEAFYQKCKSCLSAQGYIVANWIIGHPDFQGMLLRFISAFDNVSWSLKAGATRNTITMSHVGAGFNVTKAELAQNCQQLREKTGLDLSSTVEKLNASILV
jgi:spermidine synthase